MVQQLLSSLEVREMYDVCDIQQIVACELKARII
jgi:hypothetical protein